MILSSIFFLSGLNTHTHIAAFSDLDILVGDVTYAAGVFFSWCTDLHDMGFTRAGQKASQKKKKECYNYSYSTTPSLRSDLSCSWKPSSTAHWYDNSIWQVAWQCTDKSWNLKLSAKCIGCAINTEQAQKLEQKAKSKASSIRTTSAETPQQTAKKKKKKKVKLQLLCKLVLGRDQIPERNISCLGLWWLHI